MIDEPFKLAQFPREVVIQFFDVMDLSVMSYLSFFGAARDGLLRQIPPFKRRSGCGILLHLSSSVRRTMALVGIPKLWSRTIFCLLALREGLWRYGDCRLG